MSSIAPPPSKASFAWTIALLSVSVTLFWTAVYYSFATMLPLWEREEGWDKTTLTALFAVMVILSALAAPSAGRLIDAGKGPLLVGCGGVLTVLVLALAPFAPNIWVFASLWVLLGFAKAATLYEPVFAMVTRAYGAKARRAITIVTLVGALAGTLAFPLVHALSQIGGWHLASFVLAAMIAVVAAPLHVLVAIRLERLSAIRTKDAAEAKNAQRRNGTGEPTMSDPAAGKRNLALLTAAFALAGASHGLIVNHILPIMAAFDFSADMAVLAASAIGPMQLLARLAVLGTEERLTARTITLSSCLALGLSALCLLGSASLPVLLVGFGLLQGFGYGSVSIMRPVLLRESVGEAAFGHRSGEMARVYIAAIAIAPLIGSLLWTIGGYPLALIVSAGACLLAMGLVGQLRTDERETEA